VIGYSIRAAEGRLVFGTSTTVQGFSLPPSRPARHTCRIRSRLTVPAQNCYVAVGLARDLGPQPKGKPRYESIHRIYDLKRITVSGTASSGAAWCETTFSLDEPKA
jgi:hypothetical protein